MVARAWVSRHTGLPSLYSDADQTLIASDGRILHRAGDGAPVLVSDALATPGVPVTYTLGESSHTLTRQAAKDPRLGILAGPDGRPVDGIYLVNNQDPTSWDSSAVRNDAGTYRWKLRSEPVKGSSQLLVLDPTKEQEVEEVLRSRAPIVVGPAVAIAGVPLRLVVVKSVSRSRLRLGRLSFDVSWEAWPDLGYGAVPVLTWGDWVTYRDRTGDLADHSYLELAQLIAGMPS